MPRRFVSAGATLFAGALASSLVVGRTAHANGRFPASNAVLFSPAEDHAVFVRVTFGLLVTRDDAKSWQWICERAIGFSGPEDPSYVVTRSGAIVAGLFDGLHVSRDGGCDWTKVPTEGATVFVDLTTRGDGAVVALASSYDRHGDAGSLYKSQLWLSTDDAKSWKPLGPRLDPTLLAESVEVAPGDPSRVYVSAVRGEDPSRQGVLLVSTDGGAHFTERAVQLEPKELAPFIAAVDPKRAERMYMRTSASPEAHTRLLYSNDAGKTFTMVLGARGPLLGFVLSPDGKIYHAGGPDDGLWAGVGGTGEPMKPVSPLRVQCLARSATELWACSSEAGGFFAGAAPVEGSGARGVTFGSRLHLRDIAGPMHCAEGTAVAKECEADFRKLRNELGLGSVGADAGAAGDAGVDAGTGADAGAGAGAGSEGGMVRGRGAWMAAIVAVLGGGIAMWIRRKRK